MNSKDGLVKKMIFQILTLHNCRWCTLYLIQNGRKNGFIMYFNHFYPLFFTFSVIAPTSAAL
jgi:hypothetical protein